MYIKPPAVNGSIAAVLSPACSADSDMRAVMAPSRPPLAVTTYKQKSQAMNMKVSPLAM